jgi:MoaA/NifB/PqqE/SkfB family radical SAM enzyme
MDGPPSLHDAGRGIKGALDKTLGTVAALKDLREVWGGRVGRVTLCTAISKRNLEDLPFIIKLVRSIGALHSFTFVRSSKTGVFNLKKKSLASDFAPVGFKDYLTVAEMDQAMALLHQHLWRHEPFSLFYRANRTALENIVKSLKARKPQAPCFSGLADLVLLPNGDVARCEMLRSFANLKDYQWDLRSLLHSEAFQSHLQETRGCWCIHDCAIALSIMYDENLLIDLFKPG